MESDERKIKVKEDICAFLKEGMYKKDAARLAGISEDTYLRWYKEDADFADRVEANILEYKRSLVRSVNLHAEKNGLIAFKILQTRWPGDNMETEREAKEGSNNDVKMLAESFQALLAEYRKKNLEEETSLSLSSNMSS